MDFIPQASDPAYPTIEIPYFLNEHYNYKYDYSGFTDYPARCGWDKSKILSADFEGRAVEDVRAFLQSWLYFGTAAEILHGLDGGKLLPLIEDELLVVTEAGDRIIDNTSIRIVAREYFEHLMITMRVAQGNLRNLPGMDDVDRNDLKASLDFLEWRIDSVLDEVNLYVRSLNEHGYDSIMPAMFPAELSLSITVLCDMFKTMRNMVFVRGNVNQLRLVGKGGSNRNSYGKNTDLEHLDSVDADSHYKWGQVSLITQRLQSQGWCESDISYLEGTVTSASQLFVSTFRRYGFRPLHILCSQAKCHAFNVPSTYQHYHLPNCNLPADCRLVSTSQFDVESIIEAGNIPLVTFHKAGFHELRLEQYQKTGEHDFVAISHIWSEGLGNLEENAMWSCQLERLQNLVSELVPDAPPDGIPFWIDTLCMPQRSSAQRDSALSTMQQVYELATHVLVIDDELQMVPVDIPFYEALFRIALSGWNRRLWTLQEGALARNLWFQFKERSRSWNSLIDELTASQIEPKTSFDQFSWSPLLNDCVKMTSHHKNIVNSLGSQRLVAISQAVQRRTCSVPSDEALCLAILLKIDLKPLLNIPEDNIEARMAYIWSTQTEIPKSVFNNEEQIWYKLNRQGLPWASISLMNCCKPLARSNVICHQENGQLKMSCPAFVLQTDLNFYQDRICDISFMIGQSIDESCTFVTITLPGQTIVKDPVVLVPYSAESKKIENNGIILDGLLVSQKDVNISSGRIEVDFRSKVSIRLHRVYKTSHSSITSAPNSIEALVLMPSNNQDQMPDVYRLFDLKVVSGGMVSEFIPNHLDLYLRRLVLILRALAVYWRSPSSSLISHAIRSVYKSKQIRDVFKVPISRNDITAATTALRDVLLQFCSANGFFTSSLTQCVRYIIDNYRWMGLESSLHGFWHDRVGQSGPALEAGGPVLLHLVDPDFEIPRMRDAEFRRSLLSTTFELAEHAIGPDRCQPPSMLEEDNTSLIRCREHWVKLLAVFVIQDPLVVEEIYPREHEWCLNFHQARTSKVH